jgi:SAM-dependent methyltransferase
VHPWASNGGAISRLRCFGGALRHQGRTRRLLPRFRGTPIAHGAARAVLAASGYAADRGWSLAAYNPALFAFYHLTARDNAPGLIGAIEETFPNARSYLDVGAGSGAFSAESRRRGKYVVACENSPFGRAIARAQRVDARPFDLECDPPAAVGSADLGLCIEVAEHLPPKLGDSLVRFLTRQATHIVFSAAHPGQGGTGHINEQPKEYWRQRFALAGAEHDAEASERLVSSLGGHNLTRTWYEDNAMVFRGSHRRA